MIGEDILRKIELSLHDLYIGLSSLMPAANTNTSLEVKVIMEFYLITNIHYSLFISSVIS